MQALINIIIILAGLLPVGTGVDVSLAAPRLESRIVTTGQPVDASVSLGDRFGFIGSAHRPDAPEALYYFYARQPEPQPASYVRIASPRNGRANDLDSPDKVTFVADHSY
ncbi:MAG: hypothetical protein M1358_14230, partial [Chloroflexi bacterium]|nr:hypothetical protein [Chloroflexota bacterium]